MSRGVHIVSVSLPEAPAMALAALESGGLSEAVSAIGEKTTVVISFGDGRTYEYPNVPSVLALSLKSDPEGVFPSVKFWPGYHRVA